MRPQRKLQSERGNAQAQVPHSMLGALMGSHVDAQCLESQKSLLAPVTPLHGELPCGVDFRSVAVRRGRKQARACLRHDLVQHTRLQQLCC